MASWLDKISRITTVVHEGVRYPSRERLKFTGTNITVTNSADRTTVSAGVTPIEPDPRFVYGAFSNGSITSGTALTLTKTLADGVGPGSSTVADLSGTNALIIPANSRWRLVFNFAVSYTPVASVPVVTFELQSSPASDFSSGVVAEYALEITGAVNSTTGLYPAFGDVVVHNETGASKYLRFVRTGTYANTMTMMSGGFVESHVWALMYAGDLT